MASHQKTVKYSITAILLILFLLLAASPASDKKSKKPSTIGERFHNQSSLSLGGLIGDVLRAKPKKPAPYKHYADAKKFELPKPDYTGLTVAQAIKQRRSLRTYSKEPITKSQLSQLLFAAQGITEKTFGRGLRVAPSAGALYPFEIYIVANNVRDLPKGIYHYSVLDHGLELLKEGDFSRKITSAGIDQDMLGKSGVTFILSAIFDRVRQKYGERGYRYTYIEAGHISQNIYLQAVSLNLGSVCVGAFFDDKVNELIDVDGRYEAAVYLHAVGSL